MQYTREPNYEYAHSTAVHYKNEDGTNVVGSYVFRKRGEKVQVLVVKEIESPEFATKLKPILQRMNDFAKGKQGVTMETKISTLNEYWQEEPSAKMVLKGWKENLSARESRALANVTRWSK